MNIGKANDLGFKLGEINGGTSFDLLDIILKVLKPRKKEILHFNNS